MTDPQSARADDDGARDGQGSAPAASWGVASGDDARRFCNRCGARWDPSWQRCPHCDEADRKPRRPVAFLAMRRHIRLALSMYFIMLACCACGLILVLTEAARAADIDIFCSLAIAGAAALGALVAWKLVLPALLHPARWRWYVVAAGLACATFGLGVLVTEGFKSIGVEDISYSQPFLEAGYGWGMVVFIVAVLPGIFEELAFRGVVLGALRDVMGLREAVIASSLMFAVLHLSFVMIPYLLIIGLLLAFLRVRSGSLLPGILMHFTHNLLVVLAEAGGL